MLHFKIQMKEYLRPKSFFLGLFLGFTICCTAGYVISKTARFYHFKRFFSGIQPNTLYYATPEEVLATARHQVSHDKILVLIGGNSIMKGVNQNPHELWSNELQRLLGNQYKVVNFAMDGASINSFGGVIFRILKKEYPKIIFVSTCSQFIPEPIEGVSLYTYFFWDAYYKNLIPLEHDEIKRVQQLRKYNLQSTRGLEEQITAFLDSYFYFNNFWNWVSYRFVFTAWSDYIIRPFCARRYYIDENIPNLKETLKNFEKVRFADSVKFLSIFIKSHFKVQTNGEECFNESLVINASVTSQNSFLLQDRVKILTLIPTYNPKYLSNLSMKKQQQYSQMINKNLKMLEALHYPAMVIGKDFLPDDYADAAHLTGSGGQKLAIVVAEKVNQMAILNGYFNSKE